MRLRTFRADNKDLERKVLHDLSGKFYMISLDNTGALVYNSKRVREATSPIGHPRSENSVMYHEGWTNKEILSCSFFATLRSSKPIPGRGRFPVNRGWVRKPW